MSSLCFYDVELCFYASIREKGLLLARLSPVRHARSPPHSSPLSPVHPCTQSFSRL